jgi:Rrf2 family protein
MISKSTLEAIKALIELAKLPEGEYAGARSIAGTIHAPANYLGKLLQQLAARGLVSSQKGTGGGFRLSKPAADISIYEVMACLEDVGCWTRCFMGWGECTETSPCCIHAKWKGVRDVNLNFLKGVTVADL